MMDIILFLVVFIITTVIFNRFAAESAKASAKPVDKTPSCPPHQWYYEEVLDENGKMVCERIVCKKCNRR